MNRKKSYQFYEIAFIGRKKKTTKDETKNKTSKKEIVKASGKEIGVRELKLKKKGKWMV